MARSYLSYVAEYSNMKAFKSSAGESVPYPEAGPGVHVFLPNPLPQEVPTLEVATHAQLAATAGAIGELRGLTSAVPNPDLFLAMYARKEALLSSAIEGIESTLDDVLDYEDSPDGSSREAAAIVHYVAALNLGLTRVRAGESISLPMVQELHGVLLQDAPRDGERDPGRFRTRLVHIGRQGDTLATAIYVPPPVERMAMTLGNFAYYVNEFQGHDPLMRVAMAHAHFETIHPFFDGNGRIGRMIAALMLAKDGLIEHPLIYPSVFLRDNRREYYDRLMAVRERGDWDGWVRFFSLALESAAREAAVTVRKVVAIRDELARYAKDLPGTSMSKLVQVLFATPVISINTAAARIGVTYNPANQVLRKLEVDGWVREISGKKRGKAYRFERYLEALEFAGENEPGLKTRLRSKP